MVDDKYLLRARARFREKVLMLAGEAEAIRQYMNFKLANDVHITDSLIKLCGAMGIDAQSQSERDATTPAQSKSVTGQGT